MNPLDVYKTNDVVDMANNQKAMYRQQAEQQIAALQLQKQQKIQQEGMPKLDSQTSQPSAGMKQGKIMDKKYQMTQAFGNKSSLEKFSGGVHYGTDFATPMNTPIALPTGNWVIEQAAQGFNDGYGTTVLAVNQDTGEKLRFSHLARLNANPGQNLQGSSVIGFSGSTGNSSGNHIDLEYYTKAGKPANILASSYANQLWQ